MADLLFMHCDREKKKIQWFVDDDSDTTHFSTSTCVNQIRVFL